MRKRKFIMDKIGPWGQVTVYTDYVLLRPDSKWCRKKIQVIRHALRGRGLREYDYARVGPMVMRRLLAMGTRNRWFVMPDLTKDRNIQAINEMDQEQILLVNKDEPWRINSNLVYLDRTHDGIERHFRLDELVSAQKLYDDGEILALKIWIVDEIALGNVRFASALAKSVTDRLPSGKIAQPMDMFAFWIEEGNIFAHSAFGERIRLLPAFETSTKRRENGYILWKDIPKKTRKVIIERLSAYF